MIVIIIYCQYLSQKYSIYRILIIEIYMQTCGCSLGSTQNQPFHRQSSAYKHCKSALYQSNPPYSLDEFQAGCGLKKYRKYGQYQTGNYKNNMTCSQFNSINFHRKCRCYLKLNLQCQCSCGMLPSMFHKLVCAPYITISKNKSSEQSCHQMKKTKTKKNCSNCHCKCHNKPNNKQKLDLLSDQQNYVPKTIQYQPQPTQIITYGPPPPVYRPTPPQSIVSFKSVPTHSVRNIVPPPPPPPPNQIIIESQRKNILRQVPVINEVVNQPVVRVSTGVQPSSNHGIFVLEQSKKSIKVPPPPAPPINTSQTSIYQIPQQRMPIKMQPQQINPNFFNFLAAQQAMQRQHQAQLFKQQQNQQMMQNNEEDQQYEQEIEEEEYEEVQQDGDGQEN